MTQNTPPAQRIKILCGEAAALRAMEAISGILRRHGGSNGPDELRLYAKGENDVIRGVAAGPCQFSQALLLELRELMGKDMVKVEERRS